MTAIRKPTLGTLLRRLVEHLDGAVDDAYVAAGLDYRPRYTPIVRTLIDRESASIRELAAAVGTTHSAASQTVSEMARRGLVVLTAGADARERRVALSSMGRDLVPELQRRWTVTEAAARSLDRELSMPLTDLLNEALEALRTRPFSARIAASSRRMGKPSKDAA